MSEIPESFYGHSPTPAIRYWCADCGRDLKAQPDGSYTHVAQSNYRRDDGHAWWKLQEAARKTATLAEAVPYTGAISKCQAVVNRTAGRAITFGRCDRRAKFAVTRGDDHIAVCPTHAKDRASRRYTNSRGMYGLPSASEQIEPEYQ